MSTTGSQGEVDRILDESTPTLTPKQVVGLWAQAWALVRGGWRAPPRHDRDGRDAAEAKADAAVTKALADGRRKAVWHEF